MGLTSVVCTPKKAILSFDTSIVGGDYQAYRESLFDEKHLKLDAGNPPTRFTLRQWTDEHRDAIAAQPNGYQRIKMGIRCGLLALENYSIKDHDTGETKVQLGIELENAGELGNIISEDALKKLRIIDDWRSALFLLLMDFSNAKLPLSEPSSLEHGDTGELKTANEQNQPQVPDDAGENAA